VIHRKRIVIASCVLAGLAVAQVGSAQFLSIGPQLVFDPEVFGQVVAQVAQIAREYTLLMQTYQMTTNTYNVLLNNARMIQGKNGWMYLTAPLMYPSASNTYGTTGGWMGTLNTGLAR